jgi:hypothetical protein
MRRNPLLVALVLLVSCGGDGTGPAASPAALTGSWALSGFELREVGNPANHLSLYDEGIRGTIVIQDDGQFSFRVTVPGEDPDTLMGAVALRGDTLLYSYPTGYSTEFRLSVTGATMHWEELESQEEADLDEDGSLEEVITVLDWRKQ